MCPWVFLQHAGALFEDVSVSRQKRAGLELGKKKDQTVIPWDDALTASGALSLVLALGRLRVHPGQENLRRLLERVEVGSGEFEAKTPSISNDAALVRLAYALFRLDYWDAAVFESILKNIQKPASLAPRESANLLIALAHFSPQTLGVTRVGLDLQFASEWGLLPLRRMLRLKVACSF